MKNPSLSHAIGIPVSSVSYAAEEPGYGLHPKSYGSSNSKQNKKDSIIHWMSKFSKKANSYVQGIRDHVILGPNISETVKGKLSLSARILQAGGIESLQTGFLGRGGREAAEGLTVLSVDHRCADRWHTLYLYQEDRIS